MLLYGFPGWQPGIIKKPARRPAFHMTAIYLLHSFTPSLIRLRQVMVADTSVE